MTINNLKLAIDKIYRFLTERLEVDVDVVISRSPDNSTSVICLEPYGVEFSCPLHQDRNCKLCQYFLLKGVKEYLMGVLIFQVIIIIFQFYQVPCSFVQFQVLS